MGFATGPSSSPGSGNAWPEGMDVGLVGVAGDGLMMNGAVEPTAPNLEDVFVAATVKPQEPARESA